MPHSAVFHGVNFHHLILATSRGFPAASQTASGSSANHKKADTMTG
ncbi:MAG: hypothetical protein U1D70_08160 [Methylobacter sp.]|nr:hypothetical protein [Methylobacter sp.]MDP2427967.1 hypothetical protein [Methylobacter sp.]MDP3054227.1 hypothetical protein [Methylobacter sp.]MDP3361142.1 hypothetical protein [Methylobacter sp.]MDZ4218984.1 hypothetical protein [Methylobacter sp.]